jgi:tRNA threonylcarbamoyl adenosine modification protein (Sua5/YciO/YrdC/YwlC family)
MRVMLERITFDEYYINQKDLRYAADKINAGAIVIFPTDTIYALGCLMTNKTGIDRICRILNKKEKQARLSLICPDISTVASYTPQIDNQVFRTMKRYLPGPYTFILKSNNYVQKFFKNNREEIGIRIPDHPLVKALLPMLEAPLISTSLNNEDGITGYYTDPEDIAADFNDKVDLLLDFGAGTLEESTVLDCTGAEIILVRQGKGEVD